MSIPYSSLPSYSELFLSYINNFEGLKEFFEFDYRSDEDIFKCIESKKGSYLSDGKFSRNNICDLLRDQNEKFSSGEKTFENIKQLNSSNAFAIVTGQQLGFLTGPYYTILKAINTLQLADRLNKKFTDYKFIPVFWLEADDHDFLEINNVNVITKNNELKKISYFEKGEELEKYLKPSGNIIIDEYIDNFISEIEESYNKSDFSNDLLTNIKSSYQAGVDIKTAFAKYLNAVLFNKGLVFIDPSDSRIKNLLKPVFKKELDSAPEVCEKVITTSVELEKKYTVQVKPKAINLFHIHEGNRYLLEPRDNDVYALKHSRTKFSKDELYSILESNPEKFSWNVVTRPICEDYLLPTVAYIAGPSEVSYFGQFKEVYNFFDITMPVIYPRTSVTIIENRVKDFMEKYGVRFNELFDENNLSKKILKTISDVNAEEVFTDLKEELTGLFYTYEKELSRIDKVQTENFSKRNRQFLESLDVAKEKFHNTQIKQNETVSNQLSKVRLYVYPDDTLQERVLNITYFLNKYGTDLIEKLITEIKIDKFEHQLIYLSSGVNQ